jgi:hypothetical protein
MAQKTDVFPIIAKKRSSLVKIIREASSSGDHYWAIYLPGGTGHRLNSVDPGKPPFSRGFTFCRNMARRFTHNPSNFYN